MKQYYHATSFKSAQKIQKSGFKLGKDGMFGGGIYFCENPMNAKVKARSDPVDTIIIVNLDVGRLMTEERAHNNWNLKKLNKLGYDSVQMTHCKTGLEICLYEPSRVKVHSIVHWDDSNIEFEGEKTEEIDFKLFQFIIQNKKVTFNPPKNIDIDAFHGEEDELKRKLFQQFFVLEELLMEEEEKNTFSINGIESNFDKDRLFVFQEYLETHRKLGDDYPDMKNELFQSCKRLHDKLLIERENDLKRVEIFKADVGDEIEVSPNKDLEEMIDGLEYVMSIDK